MALFFLSQSMRIAILLFITCMGLFSCSSIPAGLTAVHPFDVQKYLGTWYEVARFDYRFERNLEKVSATYSRRGDGLIKVENKGYDYIQKKWKQSVGKAKPARDKETGMLKVSFFGPFYAGYNVIAIDADYQYALVAGDNLNYLWLLSRTGRLPDSVRDKYLQLARKAGFKTEDLIWVKQDR